MKPEEAPNCRELGTAVSQAGIPGIPGTFPVLCSGCGSGIRERFLLRVGDSRWHERCLRCCECHSPLRGSCFCRHQRLYCPSDYHKLFPPRCSSCLGVLGLWEPIHRLLGLLFHPRCLRCGSCGRRLHRGDEFVLRRGLVLCRAHWDWQFLTSSSPNGQEAARSEDDEGGASRNSQNSQKSQKPQNFGKDPKGPKRPRTILSPLQRRAFRESFQVSSKPCRKVRESLAAQTGLTVRVVQVWFQNQRAKMKKMARRQQQLENSRDSRGVFQGSLAEELIPTENSQLLIPAQPGIPKIPKIPEPGDPGIPKIPKIPGIPEPGNPIELLCSMQSSYFTS